MRGASRCRNLLPNKAIQGVVAGLLLAILPLRVSAQAAAAAAPLRAFSSSKPQQTQTTPQKPAPAPAATGVPLENPPTAAEQPQAPQTPVIVPPRVQQGQPAAPAPPPPAGSDKLIEEIVVHGNRRIPADTIKQRIFSRPGDVFDEQSLQRDFSSLWNTDYFEDLRIEREDSPKGYRIHVYVKERPTIRTIDYKNLNSVSRSDVLERFKKAKVGLSVESQYDPTKVKKAEVTIKEMLAEHGRQFATVRTEIRPIPPAAVAVTFVVKEGPKVKVGRIRFEGNRKVKSRNLRAAMKNLRPIGIPHSIFLENIWARTFDATKLNEDAERVREAYHERGYFKALVGDPKTNIRDTAGFRVPVFTKPGGKVVDITIPVEEGERFRLGSITFKNNKAVSNEKALRGLFAAKDGDWLNTAQIGKGLENLRKAYGELGYINFTAVPESIIDDAKKTVSFSVDLDEGKPFFVRRIEFSGNTTTRDKVIRRELAVEEGHVYNSRLWELSLLRLNQLQFFDPLDPEKDSDIKRNEREGTVDINLKVKEKGKNTIGLTGGVSGLSGSYIGLNYETNNFLGLGETLRLEASVGDRERNLLFGFTEPYLFDRPLVFGFTVFNRKFDYDQALNASILAGRRIDLPAGFQDALQNYSTSSTGFTVSSSYPLRRSFKRVGLTYSLDTSSVTVFSAASRQLFEQIAFRGISGQNALQGVITSKLLPQFSSNTIDNPQRAHRGKSLFLGGDIAGLGGNVSFARPVVEFKHFIPVNKGRNTLGYRVQGSFITGFAGRVAPPFERFYMGGENDLRGFDIRSISPVAFLTDRVDFPLTNPDGSGVPRDPTNPRRGNVTIPLAVQRIVYPGGDSSLVSNIEYRVPIVGPVVLAAFADFGLNMTARGSQLRLASGTFNDLTTTSFGCTLLDPTATNGCTGGVGLTGVQANLKTVPGTNFVPRMSTGLELQVILPVLNAPVRIYYAYNPLSLNTIAKSPNQITRSMFPAGGAGDYSYQQAQATFGTDFLLKEPKKTFRFTVSTSF